LVLLLLEARHTGGTLAPAGGSVLHLAGDWKVLHLAGDWKVLHLAGDWKVLHLSAGEWLDPRPGRSPIDLYLTAGGGANSCEKYTHGNSQTGGEKSKNNCLWILCYFLKEFSCANRI